MTTDLNHSISPGVRAEIETRLAAIEAAGLPYLVAEFSGRIAGYAYAGPYRPRPAYRYTVEDSVYVERRHRGAGLGGLILAELIRRARELEHHSILARITARNSASLRLHARHGFEVVGTERESAYKLGRWHDVTIMQRRLDSR